VGAINRNRPPLTAEEIDAAVTLIGETRMEGVGYSVAHLEAPFCFAGVSGAIALCYLVKKGTLWLELEGKRVVELRPRTVVGSSGLVAHWFKSDPRASSRRAQPLVMTPLGRSNGEREADIELVVGHVPLESLALAGAMGDMIVVPPDVGSPVSRRIWNAYEQIEDEMSDVQPMGGMNAAVRRFSELILLNISRHSAAQSAADSNNFANTHLDIRIMRATAAASHGQLSDWTLARLAKIAGMSRTTFAERFHKLTGRTPLQTITHMRLRLAASELARGDRSVAQVADDAGYGSSAAFIRAFERYFDVTPRRWRVTHRS